MIPKLRFHASKDADRLFNNEIRATIVEFDKRVKNGFIPWLLNQNGLHGINHSIILVIFITQTDIAKKIAESHYVNEIYLGGEYKYEERKLYDNQFHRSVYDINGNLIWSGTVVENTYTTQLPPVDALKGEIELDSAINELSEDNVVSVNSSYREWLGLYTGEEYPIIFIRADKTCAVREFSNIPTTGLLTVLLHEFAHATMDINRDCNTIFTRISESCVGYQMAKVLTYAQNESLANAFAYRAIRNRAVTKRSAEFLQVKQFMESQPFVYALGTQFGAMSDFALKTIILMWINACRKCVRINSHNPFSSPLSPLSLGSPNDWLKNLGRLKWSLSESDILSAYHKLFG